VRRLEATLATERAEAAQEKGAQHNDDETMTRIIRFVYWKNFLQLTSVVVYSVITYRYLLLLVL
jgi:hypothetical protein